jgi:hypothetical protein
MDDVSATSTDSTTPSGDVTTIVHLLNLLKQNKLEVLVGALIAQQMGWLTTATTHLSGVCF